MPQIDSRIPADDVAAYAADWDKMPRDMDSVKRRVAGLFDGDQSPEFYRGMMNAFTAMMMLTTNCTMLQEAPELAGAFAGYLAKCRTENKTPGA